MSKICNGYGHILIGNEDLFLPNHEICDRLAEGIYNALQYKASFLNNIQPMATPLFCRYSALRYRKDTTMVMGECGASNNTGTWLGEGGWTNTGWMPLTSNLDTREWWRCRYYTPYINIALATTYQMAVGSMAAVWKHQPSATPNVVPYWPAHYYGSPAVTFVDVEGTRIGRVFQHAKGFAGYFDNGVGDIPLSQGDIEIGGVYAPPENQAYTRMYRVYHTKSGGCGTLETVPRTGTDGSVTTSSDDFVSASTTFVPGDAGKYIVIRGATNAINNGAFLIMAQVNATTVIVDATTINQPFVTEGSLNFEVREGPIGEYFFQKRTYHYGTGPSSQLLYNFGSYYLDHMHNELRERNSAIAMTSIVHDRGACWWFLSNHNVDSDNLLLRWKHWAPEGFDPVYADGDIINGGADMPVNIRNWRDISIDADDKLWMCWEDAPDAPDADKRLAKIDPYPTVLGSPNSLHPECLATYAAQTDATDDSGLCNNKPRGLVSDRENNITWVFHGGSSGEGGISYTEDGGTTWKRLHKLTAATGNAAVVNGNPNVNSPGSDTSFTTEFAVGDWIRFGADTRSYEIASITDDDNLVLATNYAGTGGTYSIQKGVLANNEARIHFSNTPHTGWSQDNATTPPCDYDTTGYVYWIPDGRNMVCRFRLDIGIVETIAIADLCNFAPHLNPFTLNELKTLTVSRLHNSSGMPSDHPLHNAIWVGSFQQGLARILQTSFVGANATYYNYDQSDSLVNLSVALYNSGPPYNVRAVTDYASGQVYIIRHSGIPINHTVFMYKGAAAKEIGYCDTAYAMYAAKEGVSEIVNSLALEFDAVGLGQILIPSWYCNVPIVHGGPWMCHVWDGDSWDKTTLNQHSSNIDFEGVETYPGPYIYAAISAGNGTKRMHEDWQPLEHGLKIRFNDLAGPIAQEDQFVIDENETFAGYIGTGNDNLQEAKWKVDYHTVPTVYRDAEPVIDTHNMWTSNGGVDGGFIDAATPATDFPSFTRGVAEYDAHAAKRAADGGQGANYYKTFASKSFNTEPNSQYMAALRIADDLEIDADINVTGGGSHDIISATRDFLIGDIGKTFIMEGAVTDTDNNGASVITAINVGGNSKKASVVRTYTNAEAGDRRWKLQNIPAAGYVSIINHTAVATVYKGNQSFYLYNSNDRGQTWDLVKKLERFSTATENQPISDFQSDGAMINIDDLAGSEDVPGGERLSTLFDLRDLDEHVRRRAYWKVYRVDYGSASRFDFGSIIVYDEDLVPIGRPASCRFDDALEPEWVASYAQMCMVLFEGGANTISGTDDLDGDEYTNLLTISGGNFYEDNGTDGVTSGNNFQSITAEFEPEDKGKVLRIIENTSTITFAVITSVNSSTSVDTDTAFVGEAGRTWALLAFNQGDRLYFDEGGSLSDRYQSLRSFNPVIDDVPSSTTITVTVANVPLTLTGATFNIWRNFPDGVVETYPSGTFDKNFGVVNGYDKYRAAYSVRQGTIWYSDDVEFVKIMDTVEGCSTPADDDGDGRTFQINLPAAPDAEIAAGDYVLVEHATYGRRVFEVHSKNSSPAWIRVTYDELHCGLSLVNCTFYRRRFWKARTRTLTVIADSTI